MSVSAKIKVGIAVLVGGAMGFTATPAGLQDSLDDVYFLEEGSRVNPRQLLYGVLVALGGCARGPAPGFF